MLSYANVGIILYATPKICWLILGGGRYYSGGLLAALTARRRVADGTAPTGLLAHWLTASECRRGMESLMFDRKTHRVFLYLAFFCC